MRVRVRVRDPEDLVLVDLVAHVREELPPLLHALERVRGHLVRVTVRVRVRVRVAWLG